MGGHELVPRRTALVNVDMQQRFVDRAAAGTKLLQRINEFASLCRAAKIMVVHTSHVLRPDGSNTGVLADLVEPIREGVLNKGRESAALHPDLDVHHSDILVEKPRFGAFYGTDLELILRSNGIDTIIITGISTPVCCDTTAREANARDFRVFLLSDGTATTGQDATDIQRFTLEIIDGLFGYVIRTDEMTELIAGAIGSDVGY